MVKLYEIQYEIDGLRYGAKLPARSWEHAEQIASSFGATVAGTDIHQVTAISVTHFMDFLSNLCDEPIAFRPFAEEAIEAYLSCPSPEYPNQLE